VVVSCFLAMETPIASPTTSSYASDEDSAENSEKFYASLSLESSVYDEALVIPLISAKEGRETFLRKPLSWLMLFINIVMQAVILLKIMELCWVKHAAVDTKMWGVNGGACDVFAEVDVPMLNLPTKPATGETFLNCVPEALMLASKFALVDKNGDGMFTYAEAMEVTKDFKARMPHRSIQVDWLFENIVDHMVSDTATQVLWSQYNTTGIPATAWAEQQKILGLCQILTPAICPNLEARDILAGFITEDHAARRIATCESILKNICPDLVGEKYKQFQIYHSDLCGDQITSWHGHGQLRTVKFSTESKWANWEGISGPIYCGFLMVMLIIWWLAMLSEMRMVYSWWLLVCYFPTTTDRSGSDCAQMVEEDDAIKINIIAFPRAHKIYTIAFNLLPRTILVMLCSTIGSLFLIQADDYEDLILNCVALTFLIEIDEMIFAGCISDSRKEMIGSCEDLACELPSEMSHKFPWTLMHLGTTLTVVSVLTAFSYWMPSGKVASARALECLCLSAGDFCVTAQMLGGYPSVKAAFAAKAAAAAAVVR